MSLFLRSRYGIVGLEQAGPRICIVLRNAGLDTFDKARAAIELPSTARDLVVAGITQDELATLRALLANTARVRQ